MITILVTRILFLSFNHGFHIFSPKVFFKEFLFIIVRRM